MGEWVQGGAALLYWVGIVVAFRGLWLAFQAWLGAPGVDRSIRARGAAVSCSAGVLCVLVGSSVTRTWGLDLPVAWPVLPLPAWLAAGCLLVAVVALGRGLLSALPTERTPRLVSAAGWAGVGALCLVWAQQQNEPFKVLTGKIALTPGAAVAALAIAVVAILTMIAAARSASAHARSKTFVTHLALLAGCFVFGIPFVWLLLTSFKEDRDMASPEGIVWVPRVQQTVPFISDKNPYFEAVYNGQRVEANLEQRKADGTMILAVVRPVGLSGYTFEVEPGQAKQIPREVPLVDVTMDGQKVRGKVVEELEDGGRRVRAIEPAPFAGREQVFPADQVEPYRPVSLRWKNYTEALEFLPPETQFGLVYLRNTVFLVVMNVIGTLLSCALVAYAFARLKFPGKDALFNVLLATMMLPGAVTILPQFLIFKNLGWVNTLQPLWVPAFFAGAFNVFMLRQFFKQIPFELEDAAKIDGCSYLRTFWSVMVPQIKPALVVIAIWTFIGAWNNFMGPLIYVNTPELMPIAYAVQMFNGERFGEPGLLMAFVTMGMLPVLALFAFAQRYFIEGVALSGLGGR